MLLDEKLIEKRLFELRDEEYRSFQGALMPTVERERIIGVRVPALRKLAKELFGTEEAREFMHVLPHKYYEENCLHGFLIEQIKDFDSCLSALDEFLTYVDNWATCDMTSPKILKNDTDRLYRKIKEWIASGKTYTVRYGIVMLMRHYLDVKFDVEQLALVGAIRSDEYYVNMAVAWYFATALAMQYESVIPYFENKVLGKWIHNKSIQKAVESYRITKEIKERLRTLKIQ